MTRNSVRGARSLTRRWFGRRWSFVGVNMPALENASYADCVIVKPRKMPRVRIGRTSALVWSALVERRR